MKKVAVALGLLLVISNTYWIYVVIDIGITLSYRDQMLHEYKETQKQLLSMLPELAKNRSQDEVISIAQKYSSLEPFEKDGCTWVGWVGFEFADDSQLKSVSWRISYGENSPCHDAF